MYFRVSLSGELFLLVRIHNTHISNMKVESQNSGARIEPSIAGQRRRKEMSAATNKHATRDDAVLLMPQLLGNERMLHKNYDRKGPVANKTIWS
jgi:hypothetical protein